MSGDLERLPHCTRTIRSDQSARDVWSHELAQPAPARVFRMNIGQSRDDFSIEQAVDWIRDLRQCATSGPTLPCLVAVGDFREDGSKQEELVQAGAVVFDTSREQNGNRAASDDLYADLATAYEEKMELRNPGYLSKDAALAASQMGAPESDWCHIFPKESFPGQVPSSSPLSDSPSPEVDRIVFQELTRQLQREDWWNMEY